MGAGSFGAFELQAEPFAYGFGVGVPGFGVVQHGAHAVGEVGGERQAGADIGGDHGRAGAAIGAFDGEFVDAGEFQEAAGEHEGVAGAQRVGEVFLDLAQRLAVRAAEADLQQRRFGDGADVHAGLAGDAFAADVDAAF